MNVIIAEASTIKESSKSGFDAGKSSSTLQPENSLFISHPRKKASDRTKAVGAWGISRPIPKKYGRLLIKGKQKTKNSAPHSTLTAVVIMIMKRIGMSAAWKDLINGTYL